MRLAIIVAVFQIFAAFQTYSLEQIADKYGVPAAFSILVFIIFSRQLSRRDRTTDQLVSILEDQTKYLRQLVINSNFQCMYARNSVEDKKEND